MLALADTSFSNSYSYGKYSSIATPIEIPEEHDKNPIAGTTPKEDMVTLSNEVIQKVHEGQKSAKESEEKERHDDGTDSELTQEDKDVVEQLKERDQQVRAHEQAHMAAGGQYVRGGASYSYQNGPDGKRYAVGGEVSIDTSPISGNPDATINKMMAVRAAALAPAEPSGQDMSVAAAATQQMANAQTEKTEMRQKELEENEKRHENQDSSKISTKETPISKAVKAYSQSSASTIAVNLLA